MCKLTDKKIFAIFRSILFNWPYAIRCDFKTMYNGIVGFLEFSLLHIAFPVTPVWLIWFCYGLLFFTLKFPSEDILMWCSVEMSQIDVT